MRAAGMVTLSGFLMPSIAGAMNDSGGIGDAGARAIAETEAAARQADLAERGREQHHRPIGLLAVMRRAATTTTRVTIVRVAAMRRASARIVSAGTPVIAAAQSASFGWPSVSPIR